MTKCSTAFTRAFFRCFYTTACVFTTITLRARPALIPTVCERDLVKKYDKLTVHHLPRNKPQTDTVRAWFADANKPKLQKQAASE